MIFFGVSKPKRTVEKPLGMASCPNCKEEGYLDVFAYARYFHVYWIPFFSIGKAVRANCRNCDTTFKGKKMPKAAAIYIDELKKKVRVPIWHFAGVGVLIGFVLLVIAIGTSSDKQEAEYLANPKVNDVYLVFSDDGYTYWKLIEIQDSTKIFHQSGIIEDLIFDINNDDEREVYIGDTVSYSDEQIQRMYDKKEIYQIERE